MNSIYMETTLVQLVSAESSYNTLPIPSTIDENNKSEESGLMSFYLLRPPPTPIISSREKCPHVASYWALPVRLYCLSLHLFCIVSERLEDI